MKERGNTALTIERERTQILSSPVWHPFTQMKTADPALKVKSARGCFLELEDGRSIVDCISSWWVTIHGHSHPAIAQAIHQQALKLEQVIFAGFTHEPAELLAKKLLHKLPKHLSRVFFSDNGSTCVEVALKMAFQYWHNQGQIRNKFIGFDGGYHGDTLGAMSLGRSSGFFKPFERLMFDLDVLPFPFTFDGDHEIDQKESASLAALERVLSVNPRDYAGIFIEPLVQGASGMRMCRPQFLRSLANLASRYDLLLIYDEVMTGFGRTGDWFACLKSSTKPDIICLSKGISGGFLPLAATVASERIYQAFYSNDTQQALLHGHSYTGNPLSCAAANASMDLLEQNPQIFMDMESRHRKYIDKYIAGHRRIKHIRTCGTIAAMDVITGEDDSYFNQTAPALRKMFLDEGFLLRPLGNTIYIMPPYCIEDQTLESIYKVIQKVLNIQ